MANSAILGWHRIEGLHEKNVLIYCEDSDDLMLGWVLKHLLRNDNIVSLLLPDGTIIPALEQKNAVDCDRGRELCPLVVHAVVCLGKPTRKVMEILKSSPNALFACVNTAC